MKVETNINVAMPNVPEYAQVLKAIRLQNKLRQTDVATKLRISPMGLSHFENGTRTPSIVKLEAWAKAVGANAKIVIY